MGGCITSPPVRAIHPYPALVEGSEPTWFDRLTMRFFLIGHSGLDPESMGRRRCAAGKEPARYPKSSMPYGCWIKSSMTLFLLVIS
ncbi:hypothetical protein [Inquilinus sp. CAU 1745]|uniref:hypothetical protein n=1 Tax=Inquilinus sp. CAU 1745 TaxID=3140369 RepID=UPI00325AC154